MYTWQLAVIEELHQNYRMHYINLAIVSEQQRCKLKQQLSVCLEVGTEGDGGGGDWGEESRVEGEVLADTYPQNTSCPTTSAFPTSLPSILN